jgi:hypothetical protein
LNWLMMRCAIFGVVLAMHLLSAQDTLAGNGRAGDPPVYNITLINDNTPDFTDIESYLRSITSQYTAPQDKAIAVFRWSQQLRKQHSLPYEEGHEVIDPIFFFNNYGYTMCAITSGIDNSLWSNLGWKAHYVQLGDHTVCECSWDDGKTWHMFDNSISIYCFNDSHSVASAREIEKTPRFYLEQFAPECGTNPVKGLKDQQGWRWGADHPVENQRTLANGVDSFLNPKKEIVEDHLAIRWGRHYVLNLRPGEYYTRYFKNLDTTKADPRYYRPLQGKDVEGTRDKNIRANGIWHYAPNLADAATRAQVYSESGVTWTDAGVKGPGSVTFKVSAANVITSAKIALKASGAIISVSRYAGVQWEPLSAPTGEVEVVESVAGGTEFLLKVELNGPDALLSSLSIDTLTQLSRAALPRLTRGANQIQLHLGAQSETITLAPSIVNGNHAKTVFEEKSVAVNSRPYYNVPTICPATRDEAAYVTWKISAPTPIVDLTFGGNLCAKIDGEVALLHSWDGKSFEEDFKQIGMALPYDKVVLKSVKPAQIGARDVFLRYQFRTQNDPAKQWSCSGIQTALMMVQHQPRVPGFTPIEVTYAWVEHREGGDVERRHTQLVTSPAAQYSINVGGYCDPEMKWVRVNLKGHGPDGSKVAYGYSDGDEKQPAAKLPRVIYTWGKNLALGKPYKLDGKQHEKNPDSGHDLTDGVIMPPDTYVSEKWMPTNVMFPADVSPVATIDLGAVQAVAAVRVWAGQADDFHLTYPDTITVEISTDGQKFTKAGSADFNQVFDPPADYLPGECEGSSIFNALPAKGRLAYAYRILFEHVSEARFVRVSFKARKGWGMLLSEIQAFDAIKVETNVPPAVVLPPFPSTKMLIK